VKEIDEDIQLCGPIQSLVSSGYRSYSNVREYGSNDLFKFKFSCENILRCHNIVMIIILHSFCPRDLNTKTVNLKNYAWI